MRSICLLTIAHLSNGLRLADMGLKLHDFYRMNKIIDNNLKYTETYNFKAGRSNTAIDMFKEYQYRDFMEAKMLIINNIGDKNIIFLEWTPTGTAYPYPEQSSPPKTLFSLLNSIAQYFIIVKIVPEEKVFSVIMIVSNPFLGPTLNANDLKSSLQTMASQYKMTFKYDELRNIKNMRWYYDFSL
jgi:hypothetical protein